MEDKGHAITFQSSHCWWSSLFEK